MKKRGNPITKDVSQIVVTMLNESSFNCIILNFLEKVMHHYLVTEVHVQEQLVQSHYVESAYHIHNFLLQT